MEIPIESIENGVITEAEEASFPMETGLTLDDVCPPRHELFKVFSDPKLRPPIFEEMQADIDRLIKAIASKYTDVSCFQLQYEELVNEGWAKVAKLVHMDKLTTIPNRFEFFKYLKTAVNNHVKGLVQRHRFTQKRTGHKAAPKGTISFEPTKPVEISLDDPEGYLQVGDEPMIDGEIDDERLRDIGRTMTAMERLVYDQLMHPNEEAYVYAYLDSRRGSKTDSTPPDSLQLRPRHYAAGLGMDVLTFTTLHDSVKQKVSQYMSEEDSSDQQTFGIAIANLEQVFGIQVPRSIDRTVIKRLFTIAAIDQNKKLTPEVVQHLTTVGAKVPEPTGMGFRCYGVLHDATDERCRCCGIRESCSVEAANFGLGDMVLAPELISGMKSLRIPALVRNDVAAPAESNGRRNLPPVPGSRPGRHTITLNMASTPRNSAILSHITDKFKAAPIDGDYYLKHMTPPTSTKNQWIFCVVVKKSAENISIRFCKPSADLLPRLVKIKNGYYLPDNVEIEQAIGMIDQHATESFVNQD